jgi:hypothetical protein
MPACLISTIARTGRASRWPRASTSWSSAAIAAATCTRSRSPMAVFVQLEETAYLGGVYHGTEAGVTIVATDLHGFLELVLDAVTAFASDDTITDP